jgi:hypothetical protein
MPPDAAGGSYSVPRIFSTMRAGLQRDIDAYYAYKADLQRRISACGALDFSCSAVMMGAELAAFVAVNGPIVTYKEYWRDDIDEGLRLWPSTSHAVAQALFFNPQRRTDVASADAILTQYAQGHLLSMAGAPDVIGISIQTVQAIIAAITPDFLLVPLRALKEELLNTMLKAAIGMDKQQLHDYMTRPDLYFDQVMTAGAGEQVTLARFNAEYLRINDPGFTNPGESFNFRNVPAAYNTVVLSKLILLSPQSIDMLVASLGGQVQLHEPNIMLGFIRTLDGSRQWRSGAFIAEDCAFYDAIFMAIPGEGGCAN